MFSTHPTFRVPFPEPFKNSSQSTRNPNPLLTNCCLHRGAKQPAQTSDSQTGPEWYRTLKHQNPKTPKHQSTEIPNHQNTTGPTNFATRSVCLTAAVGGGVQGNLESGPMNHHIFTSHQISVSIVVFHEQSKTKNLTWDPQRFLKNWTRTKP